MSLVICRDCGTEVSTAAQSCPKCGRKFSRTSPVTWGCAGLFALALIGLCTSVISRQSHPAPTPSAQQTEQNANATRVADDLMTEMLSKGAVKSVNPSELEAQINPVFWAQCDLDMKRNTVKVVATYCKAHAPAYGGAVTLFSSRTGKKLAEYGAWGGVKIVGADD